MNLQLLKDYEVFHYQNLEKQIFEDHFSVSETTFPKKLFKIDFDKYFLIETVDWFSSESDFERLINFLKSINSDYFYASAPVFYMINAIKVPVDGSYPDYVENHFYSNTDHKFAGVGIRKSPETFFYDEGKKWAVVCDVTNDITVIGLKNEVVSNFIEAFHSHFKEVTDFLNNHAFPENLLKEFYINYKK